MFWQKLIFDFIKQNKIYIISYFIIIVILFPTESILLPKLYSSIFKSIETTNVTPLLDNIFKNIYNSTSSGLIWKIIFIWILIIIGYTLKDLIESDLIPKHTGFMRKKIFTKTIQKYSTNFSDLKIGKQITRMLETTRNLIDLLTLSLLEFIPLFITIFSIIIYFLFTDLNLGLVMLSGIIITIFSIYYFGKKAVDKSILREKSYLNMSESLSDSFSNLMNIYLNNTSKNEVNKNKHSNENHSNTFLEQHHITTYLQTGITTITFITFFVLIYIGYYSVKNKVKKPSYFVGVFMILIYYISNLLRISNYIPSFIHKYGTIINAKEFINYIFSDDIKYQSNYLIKYGNISFKNIYFKYPKKKEYVLKNLNFDIDHNEKICLLGPSGAGKSTIVKLLLRMNNFEKGDIFIDNISIFKYDIKYLRSQIIYINQKTNLFDTTIIKNILYGNENVTQNDVINIINNYDLNSVYDGLKNNIHSNAGVNGTNLSLGMQKITILLRGILKKGIIKIFDEPLAGLDNLTRIKVIKMIKNECANNTVIIITHDKEILSSCNKIINIKDINNI